MVFTNFPNDQERVICKKSKVKTLLIAILDNKGIIQKEFVPAGQIINVAFYQAVLNQFLAQKMVAVLDHPPYSPDLAPVDFFLVPCLKVANKGAHFADVNAIKDHVTAVLRLISQKAFADCFRKL